ncbi:hypothetical protein ASE28_19105 [Acidovorax sp. Root219]|nr:hypothetical protein ASE28_19105 [Acidovorax sp. Root219]
MGHIKLFSSYGPLLLQGSHLIKQHLLRVKQACLLFVELAKLLSEISGHKLNPRTDLACCQMERADRRL